MKYLILVIIMSSLFSINIMATLSSNLLVKGQIVNFTSTTVELLNGGRISVVPRNAIPKHFKIQAGKNVYAVISSKELLKNLKSKQ